MKELRDPDFATAFVNEGASIVGTPGGEAGLPLVIAYQANPLSDS